MGDVTKLIIEPAVALYGAPETANTDAFYDVYETVLGGYRNDALKAAFNTTASEYFPGRGRPWPMPAIFKKHADAFLEKQPQRDASEWKPNVSHAAPKTAADREREADREAWRKQIVKEYGSMDLFLLKTNGRGGKSTWRQPRVDRVAFPDKETQIANAAARAKRIMGERDE